MFAIVINGHSLVRLCVDVAIYECDRVVMYYEDIVDVGIYVVIL